MTNPSGARAIHVGRAAQGARFGRPARLPYGRTIEAFVRRLLLRAGAAAVAGGRRRLLLGVGRAGRAAAAADRAPPPFSPLSQLATRGWPACSIIV